jgi:ferredoxin
MKITIDREKCIGSATCVAIAAKTFELDGEGKSHVLEGEHDARGAIIDAARSCPVGAITLVEDDGKDIVL